MAAHLKFRWSIASSLTLSMVLVIVLLMSLVTFLDVRRERSIFRQELERRGTMLATTLSQTLADPLYYLDVDKVADITRVADAGLTDVEYVQVFRPDGRLLTDTRPPYGPEGFLGGEFARRVLRTHETILEYHGDSLEVTGPILAGNELLGVVHFDFSTYALNIRIQGIVWQHVWQGLILVAIGVALAYLIARFTSRYIEDLATAAGEIGQGNLDTPVPSRGAKETAELGRALERMRVQLQDLYHGLEQRVAERTSELARANQELSGEVTDRKRAEEDLLLRSRELEALFNIASILGQPDSFEAKCRHVLQDLVEVAPADFATLRVPDEREEGMRLVAYAGLSSWQPTPLVPMRSVTGQAYESGEPVVANDYPAHTLAQTADVERGLKSGVFLPIKGTEGLVEGVINVVSRQEDHFTPERVRLLTAIADGVGALLRNASLSQSLEASRGEMAVVDEVARIMTSTLDIEQVYEKFAEEVKKLVAFDRIYINRVDQDAGISVAKYLSGVSVPGLLSGQARPLAETQSEVVVRTGHSLVRRNIPEDLRFSDDRVHVASGLRSSIAVPLISKGVVIGTLGLRSHGIGTYGDREQAILERLASQIAPAVENAQLFQRVQQLALAIANIGDGVCVTDLEGCIQFVNPALEQILGYEPGELVGDSIAKLYPGGLEDPVLKDIMAGLATGAWSGEAVLYAKDRQRIPTLETASAIYDETGHAVGYVCTNIDIRDRNRAEEELRQRGRELQALSRQLVEVQEAERRHVARELHDEVGQVLTGLKLALEVIPRLPAEGARDRLEEAKGMVNELMNQVRELSLDLRPAMLDDLGLLHTLLWYFQRFTARTQVEVDYEHTGLDRRFHPDVETTAYRIVQEALTNVARHANVTGVKVRLWTDDEVLRLFIQDRGAGFDPDAALANNQSNGLAGMRERATLLGGELTFESAPGAGTSLIAELPLGDGDGT